MPKKKKDKNKEDVYKYSKDERKLLKERSKRFEVMVQRKEDLGINKKCDRLDDLFTPHLTTLEESDVSISSSDDFISDKLFSDKARKSVPLAFEKITTAIALLVKENPKIIMKAFKSKWKRWNLLLENVYYENYSIQKKQRVLRKYVYHLAKYGIGYWREYIKRTYKKEFLDDETVVWKYDIFDQVAENIHPKNIVLDNNCIGIKDVNKPANDLFIFEKLTQEEFDNKYPKEVFPKAEYVKAGDKWIVDPKTQEKQENNTDEQTDDKKILVLTYENKFECLRETWANEIPLESVPLPGGVLSVQGDKWVENLDNYDGIGVGQILELYQPIIDDIKNASLERLRQIVRPNEDHFDGVENADEADDVAYGSGSVRKWSGSPNDIKYNSPPPKSANEAAEEESLMTEIDSATMVPRNLGGTDDAKTAYQSAQNRESALNKLSIPLDSIKQTIEDAANLSIKLYKIIYKEPLETKLLTPVDDEFNEAFAIIQDSEKRNIEDDRAVVMKTDKKGNPVQIARQQFREMELPLAMEMDEEGKPTGRVVESEEKDFWELIPKSFDWEGRIEVIAESFLPVSKALEDERKSALIEFLLNVPTTDDMGNPVLKDEQGMPYTINRVNVIKERIKLSRDFDPEKIVVPMNMNNANQGDIDVSDPLSSRQTLTPTQAVNKSRPEVGGLRA